MSAEFNIGGNIDWDSFIKKIMFTKKELEAIGEFIINGITQRVLTGVTADNETLDENSRRWIAQKLREGRPTSPLQYKGGIINKDSYIITILEDGFIRIEMIPSYRDIHLELIEISEVTGKNYRDWFGISDKDKEAIREILTNVITDRIEQFFRSR